MKRQPISRKRTPEREQLIIDLIGKGVTKKAASHYAGVAQQTFHHWCKHDESFNARVKAAMEKAKADQYEALHAEEDEAIDVPPTEREITRALLLVPEKKAASMLSCIGAFELARDAVLRAQDQLENEES